MSRTPAAKVRFAGTVRAVKARIRLLRSFDEIPHSYQGYTLVLGEQSMVSHRRSCGLLLGPRPTRSTASGSGMW